MKDKLRFQYIVAEKNKEDSKELKTDVYDIKNKKSEINIGKIKWYSNWRQYCFFPSKGTVYSKGCLTDVNEVIERLEKDRK